MELLSIKALLIIALLVTLIYAIRTKKTYNKNLVIGDISMILGTALLSDKILTYIIKLGVINSELFLLAVIILILSFYLYKKEYDDFNYLWFMCEFSFSIGITLIVLSIVYMSNNTAHGNILEILHNDANQLSILLGTCFITASLSLNAYRLKN